MRISKQIGWSQESNLLYQILKQLNKLTSIIFGLKPKYKVFTALVTQTGDSNLDGLSSGPVTKGVTYNIAGSDGDFSNVGAPNNNDGTFFIATNNETPNSYGSGSLKFNTGAPVVTVLENTIGNIWFVYAGTGSYEIFSNGLFTYYKTASFISSLDGGSGGGGGSPLGGGTSINVIDDSLLTLIVVDNTGNDQDDFLVGYPIEIRVYN
jgi:hypothetical protein